MVLLLSLIEIELHWLHFLSALLIQAVFTMNVGNCILIKIFTLGFAVYGGYNNSQVLLSINKLLT